MDYTAILFRLEALFTGTTGILLIAAVGVVGIVGVHFFRMRFARTGLDQKTKSYRNVVIEPYEEDEAKDPVEAMMPKFSTSQKQF
ncbi:MAG: hypothetical protein GQ535_10925 [Rhodobacteraceae bacterium]|nr:hypothetical protein [Paracoccaceae bacterium]